MDANLDAQSTRQLKYRRWLRLAAIMLGVGILAWLPFEESHENWVVFFAVAIAVLSAAAALLRWAGPGPRLWLIYPLITGAAGALVTPLALLLMAVKSGIHGHSAPDYTPAQVSSVLLRTPLWLVSGLLIGLGMAVLRRWRSG